MAASGCQPPLSAVDLEVDPAPDSITFDLRANNRLELAQHGNLDLQVVIYFFSTFRHFALVYVVPRTFSKSSVSKEKDVFDKCRG